MAANFSLFNRQWYLDANPDVAEAVRLGLIDAEEHFNQHGKAEGRSPGPLFNLEQYLLNNPDVADAVARGETTAYDHFMLFGASEGRSPVNMFDEAFYLTQNPDVAAAVEAGLISAVEHFLAYGQGEPRAFNPAIDLGAYLTANPDVAAAAAQGLVSPLAHLLMHGASEGRDLGNGVSLSMFGDDPAFQQALASGNLDSALGRVASVAPFIPTFEMPSGWTPPADLPIPLDFTPPEGVHLVIPEGVVVPEGTELPDTFEPATPPVTPPGGGGDTGPGFTVGYGDLSGAAQFSTGQLHVGKGNPANDFSWAFNSLHGIELGLDARYSGRGDDVVSIDGGNTYVMDSSNAAAIRFGYSVVSTKEISLDTYDFRMSIDTNSESGKETWKIFDLIKEPTDPTLDSSVTNNSNSVYDWVSAADSMSIVDDGGNQYATQNIQAFQWYNGDSTPKAGDSYKVKLEAFEKGTSNLLAAREIAIDIPLLKYGDLTAKDDSEYLWVGGNNPSTGFILGGTTELELGLDVRYVGDSTDVAPKTVSLERTTNVFDVSSNLAGARFAYSVRDKNGEPIDLTKYDIKLQVDIDSTAGTNFLTYSLNKATSKSSKEDARPSQYDWVPNTGEGYPWEGGSITDDGGDEAGTVTQNIHAIQWYTNQTQLASNSMHHVRLAAYEKESGNLAALTEIVVVGGTADMPPSYQLIEASPS